MDVSAELRYYEIRFTKLVNKFIQVYKLGKLTTFVEMLAHISDADLGQVKDAMQRVLTNDTSLRIHRTEYIVTLKLFSEFNNTQIREVARCSPNTILNAMEQYESGEVFIYPRFPAVQSAEIKKIMDGLDKISNIY